MKDYHFIEGDNILPSLESLPRLSSKLKNAIKHSLCVREEQIYFGLGIHRMLHCDFPHNLFLVSSKLFITDTVSRN